jgi:PHD/YefM family antitoxin component YafN of YafNO toxin-antitoxin module
VDTPKGAEIPIAMKGYGKVAIFSKKRLISPTKRPLVITQNGKPAGVLLSPSEYDELKYRRSFLDSVGRGLSDADSGKVITTNELKAKLAQVRKSK